MKSVTKLKVVARVPRMPLERRTHSTEATLSLRQAPRRIRATTILALVLVAFGANLSGCVLETVEQTVQKQSMQDARSFNSLTISGESSSDLAITGWSADSIAATAELSVWAKNSDKAKEIGNSVNFGWTNGSDAQLQVNYDGPDQELAKLEKLTVSAPNRLNLDLETSSGDINVSGMNGNLTIKSSSGNVTAQTTGSTKVTTSSGDIRLTTGLGGTVDASSGTITIDVTSQNFNGVDASASSGSINVRLPQGVGVTLDLSASTGSIDVNYSGVRESTSADNLRIDVNGGGKVVRLETTSGDVSVTTL